MNRSSKTTQMIATGVFGLVMAAGVYGSERDYRYFAEISAGQSRIATGPLSEGLNAMKVGAGVASQRWGTLSLEHMTTLDDINGFDWDVTLVRTQFESDPLSDGWNWYASLTANRVDAGGNVSASTGFNVGFGAGVRYQISNHRLFVNGDLYNSDFGYLGGGYRYLF